MEFVYGGLKYAFGGEYRKPRVLFQPEPDSGFLGSGIQSARTTLQIWLNEANPHARVIGVYGMGGVGKTSLLQLIHNDCKKKVSTNFDFVIWYTVSQNFNILSLQDTIAESVSLHLKGISSFDTRKMELYASLENKRFLLILDDVWRPIADLEQEVGVNFGHDNSSRVLISSRYKDVVETMAANEYCMMIQPLSTEEGWKLFRRKAFRNGPGPNNTLEATARDIALECKGLPLAINTVAAAMARKRSADEWRCALDLMRKADPSFPDTHRTIDRELYRHLRWSYDNLPSDDLKMCFLYCAAFPEDAEIDAERLVEMWTAESLVPQKGTSYYMDVGRQYIDALVDSCLIQYFERDDFMDYQGKKEYIRVHDVLRDMAIYVGQEEEKCLFLSSQHLEHFPTEEETRDRKRISLLQNQISHLPTDLRCQTLVSLLISQQNWQLKEIPERFFENFISLKVLDLSDSLIEALPASVGQLGQLQCLHLRECFLLKELPDSICNLSHLQFLNLCGCSSLKYLPDTIGELKHLKHLNLEGCSELDRVNPHQICQLTSLNRLVLPPHLTPMSLEDLTNLSKLIVLEVRVKPEIKGGSMSSWSEMRELTLYFRDLDDDVGLDDFYDVDLDDDDDVDLDDVEYDIVEDDAALDILPQNMQSMKKLQRLVLYHYRGVSLPNCISSFQNLKQLELSWCTKLKELPGLEIGSDAASDGFPMLERLHLNSLDSLESIVWNEKTMLKLEYLEIYGCPVLKSFRTEELPNLRELEINGCDELSTVSQIGSLPMLERLTLWHLNSLESIVWNEKTMLKLKYLEIISCPVLKSFRTEELPNLRELLIGSCDELSNVSEIGSLPMLETLALGNLKKLESIAHWNDETMPNLQTLEVRRCPVLKRLQKGLDKLSNLKKIEGNLYWWKGIFWENHHTVNSKLSQIFEER